MNLDAMSEAFESLSPYQYAVNNPISFVDPDGNLTSRAQSLGQFDTVIITGDEAEKATKQLNAQSELEITRDEKTGKLSATGEAKTKADKALLKAINDDKITVNLEATSKNTTEKGFIVGGQFAGSTEYTDGTVKAKQYVNPNQAEIIEEFAELSEGAVVMHETLEAYFGAKQSPGSNGGRLAFTKAHNKTNRVFPGGNTDYRVGAESEVSNVNVQKQTGTVTIYIVKPDGAKKELYKSYDEPVHVED